MICVSIGRGRHRMMLAELEHLSTLNVSLAELRLDYIRRPVNLGKLVENRKCQVIATVRRPSDGGKWMRTEEERLTLLRTAIANGVDYVDLEYDIAGKIPRYGKTKRVISYHNFTEVPANLEQLHQSMAKLDPDVIKIAALANNPLDNIRILRLCRDSKIPTVAFCMGEMGITSRVLCGKFGSPWTYASLNEDRLLAPGQLTLQQMVEEFRYEQITSKTGIYGVIADPVAHSLSPRIHNAMIRKAELDLIYLPFRVSAANLDEFMAACPGMDIRGLSVTIPHKEKILKHVNVLDDSVAGIRAANTVVFRSGLAFGYNTDLEAALTVLAKRLEIDLSLPEPFAGRKILILGAGGLARTLAWGLRRAGAAVTISARDYRKSEALANNLKVKSIDWPIRQNYPHEILINCTSCGMFPDMDETPFEEGWFDKHTLVFETIYNPEQTLLIKHARAAGCETLTGVDMFVHQAARQYELFTGRAADLELMRYELKRATSAAKY